MEAPAGELLAPGSVFAFLAEHMRRLFLKSKRGRAVDSTVLGDAVARQDSITQLIAGVHGSWQTACGSGEMLAALALTGHNPVNTTCCSANTANERRTAPSRMTTALTGPWSSGPSFGRTRGNRRVPTKASAGTTSGCTYGSRD